MTAHDEEAAAIARVQLDANGGYMSPVSRVKHVLNALDRATAERDDARITVERFRSSIYELEGTIGRRGIRIRDLEAQLKVRTDAQPLGWVNVYEDGSTGPLHESEEEALGARVNSKIVRTIRVYEHPPRRDGEGEV